MSKIALSFYQPSLACLVAAVACLLFLTGCKESKQLQAQINEKKLEIESCRAQLNTLKDDFELSSKSLVILKTQQAKSVRTTTYEEMARKLNAEVNALIEREKLLEQTVERLKKDMEQYKKYSI